MRGNAREDVKLKEGGFVVTSESVGDGYNVSGIERQRYTRGEGGAGEEGDGAGSRGGRDGGRGRE